MKRLLLLLSCALWACEDTEPAPQVSANATLSDDGQPGFARPSASLGTAAEGDRVTVASARVEPHNGQFSVELPTDMLVQPFETSILATSADGMFRVFVESRPGRLLEVLGQLKDELIGLGWEVTQEKHFETATLLTLAQGPSRARYERAIWLVQAEPDTLLCDAQARAHGTSRLGASHRMLCQTLKVGASPEGATP